MNNKIKDFWQKYEYKIVLVFGFILIAVVSFEAGVLRGSKIKQEPVIIEKPAVSSQKPLEAQKTAVEAKNGSDGSIPSPASQSDCALVGSKNSNKYHLPNCRYAKNINPENRVCFSDENQAKSKGYVADKNCIK